jgi:DNA-binding IclR family transcriptional regulator
VRDASSDVVAAITVPYLTRRGERSSAIDAARETLLAEAAKLSALLGYSENHHE